MLRHKGQHHTSRLPQELYQRFGLDLNQGGKAMNAARLYGDNPELVARLSRDALFALSVPSSASVRLEVERRLADGERVPECSVP